MEFLITDSEGLSDDVGYATFLKERVVRARPALDLSKFPTRRCVAFEASRRDSRHNVHAFTHLVAICYSDDPVGAFAIGDWTHAKEISGFHSAHEAERAYSAFGSELLTGERITPSQIRRTN